MGAVERVRSAGQTALGWWKDTRAARALAWYGSQRGGLLCGGIAYSALFSLFAALTIGYTVFMTVLGSRTDLRDAVLEQIDTWIPGLVDTGPGSSGLLSPEQLILADPFTPTSIIATVVLVFSALGFMGALRRSVRAMFDAPDAAESLVLRRVWQLLGFVVLGAGVLASAVASVVSSALAGDMQDWFGASAAAVWLVGVGAAMAGVVIDALVVLGVVRLVGRIRVTRTRDLLLGCLAVGVVAGALRWLGASFVVGSSSRNPLLASFAVIVTLLVLVNFVARVLLMSCAWIYDPPRIDELDRAEAELRVRRYAEEVDRTVRRGQGRGRPWSPIVRGVRRATLRRVPMLPPTT